MAVEHANRILLQVDGRPVETLPGRTLLQALLEAGIHVPHLCFDARLRHTNAVCGLCAVALEEDGRFVESCRTPVRDGMRVTTDSPELRAYRRIRIEHLLADHNADCAAPCQSACPAGVDIQAYLRQTANGNFGAALRILKERNPLPSTCGRVCPHPCESACRRNLVDSAVAINGVKRFLADFDIDATRPYLPKPASPSGKRIAVIGAGPSGLSAAYYAALRGHDITIYDQQPEPGGMLRYGIPDYRLPQARLDQEIQMILDLGVKFIPRRRLGAHLRLEDLQQSYDAVYLAIGSWRAARMQVEGESAPGVWAGIEFLEKAARGERPEVGAKVVVVGGGNTAIDCARTALRLGAEEVRLVYRRGQEEMPAAPHEVADALAEGVAMTFLAAPTRIHTSPGSGHVTSVDCIRMQLGEADRSGRRRPVPIEGDTFALAADSVIAAIGQSTDTRYLWDDLPVKLNRWGDIEVEKNTLQTSAAKIFAGGDCVTGPATVVQAVAAGRRAAEAMHEYLETGAVQAKQEVYNCNRGSLEDLPRFLFSGYPMIPRMATPQLDPESRRTRFEEVDATVTAETAAEEARRCLQCGCSERYNCALRKEATRSCARPAPLANRVPHLPLVQDHPFILRDHNKCIACGRCVAACEEIAGPGVLGFYLKNGRMCVGTKSGRRLEDTDCVSCGQCVTACPCGALTPLRETDRVLRAIHAPGTMVVGFVAPAVRSMIAKRYDLDPAAASAFLPGMLKSAGFDKVFDFVFAADLTVMEETTEFMERLTRGYRLPQFTSCCPAWVNFVERRYPQLLPHLSSCKSPQQMMGATVRNHFAAGLGKDPHGSGLFVVSIVPCMAKKYEAARPEFAAHGVRDVDAVLTTTDLFDLLDQARVDPRQAAPAEFDEPYRTISGAGMLFGASGGVAEAAMRTAAYQTRKSGEAARVDFRELRGVESFKTATVRIDGRELRVAVISGLRNVEPLLERMVQGEPIGYDLIEVMACPGGCVAGAGHPVPETPDELARRKSVLSSLDAASAFRNPADNPDLQSLYAEFYDAPGSLMARALLHTAYTPKVFPPQPTAPRHADSAYRCRDIQVCVHEDCLEKGALQLLERLQARVHALGLEHCIEVRPLAWSGHSECAGVFVAVDGRRAQITEESDLDAFLSGLAPAEAGYPEAAATDPTHRARAGYPVA